MSNLGIVDRVIRAVAGLALIIIPSVASWPTPALVGSVVVGLVLVATAAISFCPIYAVLGLSSKRNRRAGSH